MPPRIGITALPPAKLISIKRLTRALETAGNQTLKVIQKDFQKTTRTWDRQVVFTVVPMQQSGQDLEGAVGTTNKIYLFVTRGTKPHIIRAKNGKVLSFAGRYGVKTRRRVIRSYKGGRSGKRVFAKEVRHPGTQAREFEEVIAEKNADLLQKKVNQAIEKALA